MEGKRILVVVLGVILLILFAYIVMVPSPPAGEVRGNNIWKNSPSLLKPLHSPSRTKPALPPLSPTTRGGLSNNLTVTTITVEDNPITNKKKKRKEEEKEGEEKEISPAPAPSKKHLPPPPSPSSSSDPLPADFTAKYEKYLSGDGMHVIPYSHLTKDALFVYYDNPHWKRDIVLYQKHHLQPTFLDLKIDMERYDSRRPFVIMTIGTSIFRHGVAYAKASELPAFMPKELKDEIKFDNPYRLYLTWTGGEDMHLRPKYTEDREIRTKRVTRYLKLDKGSEKIIITVWQKPTPIRLTVKFQTSPAPPPPTPPKSSM